MNKNKNNKVQLIDPVRLVRDFEEERISEIDYLKMINSFTDSPETKKSRKLKDMHLWMGILNKYVRQPWKKKCASTKGNIKRKQ